MRIYLDNSVLNRPYDDQRHPGVWMETLCFMMILQIVERDEAGMIHSAFHTLENEASPAVERRQWVDACLRLANRPVRSTGEMQRRARSLTKLGLGLLDAAHLAAAESAAADFFITCDSRLIRKYRGPLRVLTPPKLILILTKEQT